MDYHPHTGYWNRGVRNVPDMTGAKHLLDARDLRRVLTALGVDVPLQGRVLDVGCGTGRLAQLCAGEYVGVDIAPDAVDYCKNLGLDATVISGPTFWFPAVDLIACISVFTHMAREERRAYLETFAEIAPRAVVDIIPGDGSGDVARWTADPALFVLDVVAAGFSVSRVTDAQWDVTTHRYYLIERG